MYTDVIHTFLLMNKFPRRETFEITRSPGRTLLWNVPIKPDNLIIKQDYRCYSSVFPEVTRD